MVEVGGSNPPGPTRIFNENSRLRIMPSGCFCFFLIFSNLLSGSVSYTKFDPLNGSSEMDLFRF